MDGTSDLGLAAILAAPLDDGTTAYAIATRQPFEQLRQAAAQLAGVLVLAAAGSQATGPDHPMLVLACRAHEEALDAIRSLTPPVAGEHHHRHLVRSATYIGRALEQATGSASAFGSLELDQTVRSLRAGWRELQWSANALPGFEIIAFEQACCAHHKRNT